jgi:hypothetical protein
MTSICRLLSILFASVGVLLSFALGIGLVYDGSVGSGLFLIIFSIPWIYVIFFKRAKERKRNIQYHPYSSFRIGLGVTYFFAWFGCVGFLIYDSIQSGWMPAFGRYNDRKIYLAENPEEFWRELVGIAVVSILPMLIFFGYWIRDICCNKGSVVVQESPILGRTRKSRKHRKQ